jgi:hypothetical protein
VAGPVAHVRGRNQKELKVDDSRVRKQRLHQLIDLARVSRGWSRAKLAKSLGRDPTKIFPESGNPKADFLIRLAEVLGWPVGDVMEAVWGTVDPAISPAHEQALDAGDEALTFAQLQRRVQVAYQDGDYERIVAIARRMESVARNDTDRGYACAFEASGWDGLGRYVQEAAAAKRGLALREIPQLLRNILRADLANAWYSLWDLTPALGTAELLVQWYEQNKPTERRDWKRPAFVHYVRGNTHRRLAAQEPDAKAHHCAEGLADLHKAADLYESLAADLSDDNLLGIANTCRGGIIELEFESGQRSAESALDMLSDGMAGVDRDRSLTGDRLEAVGWRCIFALNVALRSLEGAELQRAAAPFLNTAFMVAERLNNWAMRERAFSTQFLLHRHITEVAGIDVPYTIDDTDRVMITATMGRFPCFRPTGWQILETATVVEAPASRPRAAASDHR